MTAEQAKELGYSVVVASPYEVGLVKAVNGVEKGVRTWWASSFDGKLPSLDNLTILKAVEIHEELVKNHLA